MKSTSFQEKCNGVYTLLKGMAMVLLAAAALTYSTNPAQADAPPTTYSTGKYQASMNTIVTSQDATWWYILVWDTETGRSKMYYGSAKNGIAAADSRFQLPSRPL